MFVFIIEMRKRTTIAFSVDVIYQKMFDIQRIGQKIEN
jgi:hypothetical protein